MQTATYERRVDALGGADAQKSDDWNDGYSEALVDASMIAAEADEVIGEAIELIDDLLNGYRKLADWANAAEQFALRHKVRR